MIVEALDAIHLLETMPPWGSALRISFLREYRHGMSRFIFTG
jgi:hypothetical protein